MDCSCARHSRLICSTNCGGEKDDKGGEEEDESPCGVSLGWKRNESGARFGIPSSKRHGSHTIDRRIPSLMVIMTTRFGFLCIIC